MQDNGNGNHLTERSGVLRNVAEDIKLPLMRIMAHIQLANAQGESSNAEYIEATAAGALRLLDSYILSTQIYSGQQQLQLQPVSVIAALHDTAQYLSKIADLHNCQFKVVAPTKLTLAMASPAALQAALIGLGYSFLNTIQSTSRHKNIIFFTAKRNSKGIETGIFSSDVELSAQELRVARNVSGFARQPFMKLKPGSSAGIMIADILFQSMESEMQVVRRRNRIGLAANLLPSRQLALL